MENFTSMRNHGTKPKLYDFLKTSVALPQGEHSQNGFHNNNNSNNNNNDYTFPVRRLGGLIQCQLLMR